MVVNVKKKNPYAAQIAQYKKWNFTPLCFRDRKQYNEWRYLAKLGNEVCSICSDCTSKYEYEMKEQTLCEKHIWSEIKFNQSEKKQTEEEINNG